MIKLNNLIPPGAMVWCDGGHYDAYWLGELERAASSCAGFELVDVGQAIRNDPSRLAVFVSVMRRTMPPHRAGPDATRLCDALRRM